MSDSSGPHCVCVGVERLSAAGFLSTGCDSELGALCAVLYSVFSAPVALALSPLCRCLPLVSSLAIVFALVLVCAQLRMH